MEDSMYEFVCNICGTPNHANAAEFDREAASCSSCSSNVRVRALVRALSIEVLSVPLRIPDFPRVKSLRGMGMTDFGPYASRLAEKFDYRNTFYDRQPKLDICNPPSDEFGKYDFLISSEIFEHVTAPAGDALRNAWRLLKPNGVLVLSVPYSLQSSMEEHFPDLNEFGLVQVGQRVVLVNRTRSGQMQTFENLIFHGPGVGRALEMREFTETALRQMLTDAGFAQVRIHSENDLEFGIFHTEACSLPIAARKADFALGIDSVREIMQELVSLRHSFDAETRRLTAELSGATARLHSCAKSRWYRIGKKIGFV
jgi:SAM-dependent methyltransferase